AELCEPHRQIAPRRARAAHDLEMRGAAHRLECGRLLVVVDADHAALEDIPMAARPPDRARHDLRRANLDVSVRATCAADDLLELAHDGEPAWVPERGARRFVLEVKEVELLPEPSMVVFGKHRRFSCSGGKSEREMRR